MSRKEYNIIWQKNALLDASIFIDYIAQDNSCRAQSFFDEMCEKVAMLSHYPKMSRSIKSLEYVS